MKLITYENAADFLEKNQAMLEKDEVINSVVLGISARLAESPEGARNRVYLATVEDEQSLILAAFMTPPFRIILYSPRPDYDKALELIAQNLLENNWSVSGTLGVPALAKAFAETWQKVSNQTYRAGLREGMYELTRVIPPFTTPPGKLRVATEADLEIVAEWTFLFQQEALQGGLSRSEAQAIAKGRLDNHEIYLWEDENPVAMAAKDRPTKNGITVNAVYTPPKARGKGYASACVAELSQLLLDSGYKFCTLFTDLSNPTSNSIYQKIGYKPVTEFHEYLFEKVSG